jgi:tetratricopeptide (TPR) repeat protein
MGNTSDKAEEMAAAAQRFELQGNLVEALACWRALFNETRDPILLCKLGRVASKIGRFEEARQAFLDAIDMDGTLPYGHECLGMWHLHQGNSKEAIDCFRASLSMRESAAVYTMLGVAQLGLGSVGEARIDFRKALEIDPRYEEAYYNLGATFSLEAPVEAVPLLRKAIEIDPRYAVAHCELGWALRLLGEHQGAASHLRRALELDPSDGLAHVYLGNLLWEQGETTQAEDQFRMAVGAWPESGLALWCLAHFYECQERIQEAGFFYEAALTWDQDDPVAHLRFGLFLKELGDIARARTHLERALTLDPDYESARLALVQLN